MNPNNNPTLKNKNRNKNEKEDKTCPSSDDDEMQCPRSTEEQKEESGVNSNDGDETYKKGKLPRVVVEETLLDTKVVLKKVRPGPKSWKKEKTAFGNIKPNASSPPPPLEGADATTEDEEKQGSFSRPSSQMETATDIANLSDFSADSAASMRTTASGAIKRTKKIIADKSKRKRSEKGHSDHRSSSSEREESDPETRGEKRGQGRPVTTGKGVEIRARVAAKRELQNLEEKRQNIERILEGGYDPSEYKGRRHAERERKIEKEIQNLPSRDIVAQMLEAAKQVELVAAKSGNLQGGFVKILKEAALKMTLGTDILMCRSNPKENESALEKQRLREEIRTLQEEMEKLRKRRDQELMPPPSQQIMDHSSTDKMEVDEDKEERILPLRPTHPPKDKWPAIRPAIQGVTKILSDEEEDILTPRSVSKSASRERPSPKTDLKITEMDVKKILNEKFKEFSYQISSQIKEEMGRLLPTLMGKTTPLPTLERVSDRARKNVPNTPAPKRDAEERPVPARKGGKGRNDRKEKISTSRSMDSIEDKKEITAKGRIETTLLAERKNHTGESWSKVVGRKAKDKAEKQKEKETNKEVKKVDKKPTKTSNPANMKGKTGNKKPRRRVPKTAAVVLKCPQGQYEETMTEVKAHMKLSEVGIQGGITTRTAVTGALIMEIPGSENGPKADALASRMREILKDKEGVTVKRPIKMAEIRVKGLECSISKEEITEAVAEKGACRSYEIKAGELRRTSENHSSLWLRLPLVAAKKAIEGGIIQIGWSRAKIAFLEARPLRCYKCLEQGHVKEKCHSSQDRSNRCYRCGGIGHIAKECVATPKCPICTDIGRKADHTLGSQQCTTQRKRGKDGDTERQNISPSIPLPFVPREKIQVQTMREEEKKEQPKPQRLLRSRAKKNQDISLASTSREEEMMETEPLEEGEGKRE